MLDRRHKDANDDTRRNGIIIHVEFLRRDDGRAFSI